MRKKYVLGFLLIVIFLFASYIYLNLQRQNIDEDASKRYVVMRDSLDAAYNFPPEWFEEKTYSKEFIVEGELIDNLYLNLGIQHYKFPDNFKRITDVISQIEWDLFHQDVDAIKPVTDKLIAYAARPDYELSAFAEAISKDNPDYSKKYATVLICAKALLMRAYSAAQQEQWTEAFEANLASHRMAQRKPYDAVQTHLTGLAIQKKSTLNTSWLIQHCDDETVLLKALKELRKIDKKVNLGMMDDVVKMDILAALRRAKKINPDIDATPGEKGSFYYKQLVSHWLKEGNQSYMSSYFQTRLPSKELLYCGRMIGLGKLVDDQVLRVSMPNQDFAKYVEMDRTTRYKLTCLSLASKLYKMNKGMHPQNITDLIPEYFDAELYDPFTAGDEKTPFAFDAQKKTFYSVGPDKSDDLNSIKYDPTNGINSRGDISAY
jgi:hypothetical protein